MPKRTRPPRQSPLDGRRRDLAARERQLRDRMTNLQRMLEDAPKKRQEVVRREREEFMRRAVSWDRRESGPMAVDHRFPVELGRVGGRARRIEKRRAKLHFAALCVLLAVALYLLVQFVARYLQ